MTDIATAEFLNELRSLYPAQAKYVDSGWYLAAAVAFSSSNRPEAVSCVFRHALEDLEKLPDTSDEDRRLLVIYALISLYEATPEEFRDTEPMRDFTRSKEEVAASGQGYFDLQYGDTAAEIQLLLRSIYPDLEHVITTLGYGYVYSFLEVISSKETPVERQLTCAVRNGATVEEVRGVREIALRIAMAAGVLKHEVPII
ncbi:hypothetical protein EV424DRAFT_1473974 [Suillus variegatus]|nr:hypothetical protein EV424DRAFT_1473974 [Suillus variegatus]